MKCGTHLFLIFLELIIFLRSIVFDLFLGFAFCVFDSFCSIYGGPSTSAGCESLSEEKHTFSGYEKSQRDARSKWGIDRPFCTIF